MTFELTGAEYDGYPEERNFMRRFIKDWNNHDYKKASEKENWWETREGVMIQIKDLETDHLINIVKMIEEAESSKLSSSMKQRLYNLKDELSKRNGASK